MDIDKMKKAEVCMKNWESREPFTMRRRSIQSQKASGCGRDCRRANQEQPDDEQPRQQFDPTVEKLFTVHGGFILASIVEICFGVADRRLQAVNPVAEEKLFLGREKCV